MVRHKVRIRFGKAGDLRLVSHHDLLRCFERMLRRAGLPFQSTQGFNPRPRLVFALSLPLGIAGRDEVADLELREQVDPDEVRRRLAAEAPPGLDILSVRRTDARASPQVRSASYRVPLLPGRHDDLPGRVAALLAAADCWFERTRPHRRRLDLRPFLAGLRLRPDALEMDLLVTPQGTARPEEILEALGLAELRTSGVVVERTRLELCDENPQPDLPAPGAEVVDPLRESNEPVRLAEQVDHLPGAGGDTPSPAPGAAPSEEPAACLPGGTDTQEGIA
jgi:radical SAM-linked protein